ncbi:MAG: hypothetical protein VCF24_27075 [Candidatus Latescibacterota bacterium]
MITAIDNGSKWQLREPNGQDRLGRPCLKVELPVKGSRFRLERQREPRQPKYKANDSRMRTPD